VRPIGWTLLGLQLVAMLVFSTVQYDRYGLTNDFANYSQAWWAIAHGHLDPFSAGIGVAFWKNNAEFALWPLALLFHLYPHPVLLLWIQDVVVVTTELVALAWVQKVVRGAGPRIPSGAGPLLAIGAAVALVADPWAYETIAFDFHFEPVAALFTLLVAYDLWSGRRRRMWWWVPLALISTGLAGVYLVGVGLSGVLAGRQTRRSGVALALVGAGWFGLFSALGGIGVGGSDFTSSYGYLLGGPFGRRGPVAVVAGAVGHPGAVLHVAGSHWAVALSFLVVVGLIGLLSPWGCPMAFVVLVPNLLDAGGNGIRYGTSFQSWPALPFVLIGSVMVLVRLLERGEALRRVAAVWLALWAAVAGVFALVALPTVPRTWLWVSPPAAAALARIEPRIPADAEVIVSVPVMGRFSERTAFYGFIEDDQTIAVHRGPVVFIFSPYESFQKKLTAPGIVAASAYVETTLGARPLGSGGGVRAFAWSPPPGTTEVTLP